MMKKLIFTVAGMPTVAFAGLVSLDDSELQ